MADAAQHVQHALRYLETAVRLMDANPATGGELNWGAVIQAAHAVAHGQQNPLHTQSRNGVRDIIGRMNLPRTEKALLRAALESTVNNLHGGFYRPDLIDWQQRQKDLADARYLTQSLLDYYGRHQNA